MQDYPIIWLTMFWTTNVSEFHYAGNHYKVYQDNYSFFIHYDQNIFKIDMDIVYYNLIYHWKSIWKEQMPIMIIASYKKCM